MLTEMYVEGANCSTLDSAIVYILDGKCHTYSDFGIQATLNANKSITVHQGVNGTCSETDNSEEIPSDMINSDECIEDSMKVYSNFGVEANTTTNSTTNTANSTTNTATNTTAGSTSVASTSAVAPTIAILVSMIAHTIFAH
ncbi:hypothetical protein PHMEG_0008604 [Phytophthora megakarya]|uniref:Uncharacterized protein n=1 Tax=Phytophthora megakarya TaxID=4795 RepID=A0A225WIC4_9STRA|nr:hypothetical protein PHMEG_0008604 [Phytophthora megakarya]